MVATAGPVSVQFHRIPCAPVDATAAWSILEAAGARPWLFLSAGDHPESRRSIVAFDVEEELVLRGHVATWHRSDGNTVTGDALSLLHTFCDQVPRAPGAAEDLRGFWGGIVGWLGFEASRLWYDLPPETPDQAPAPVDGVWRLCDGAYVIDHATGQAWVSHLKDAHRAEDVATLLAQAPAPVSSHRSIGPLSDGPSNGSSAATTWSWIPSFDASDFGSATLRIQDLVAQGDVFQVNLATRFEARREAQGGNEHAHGDQSPTETVRLASRSDAGAEADPRAEEFLRRLVASNPSPYMGIFTGGGTTIVSGSPEQLFVVESGRIRSRPIAGTRRRGRDEADDAAMEDELRSDAKEQAEHTMLVDLVRNDVARVSVPGSTHVPRLMDVERYRHVMHLTSTVEGTVRPGTGLVDWLGALFPGGTVTGAPKHRATRRIVETEPVRRGPYTGSAGFLSVTGDAAWNILIRSLVLEGGNIRVHAGSGIVADSDPHREWKEACRKAQALLDAATGAPAGPDPGRLGECTRHGSWSPPNSQKAATGRRVVLVDNEDSFVHNLADYCAALGADVAVVSCHDDVEARIAEHRATHVILSPGPGRPEDAGATPHLAKSLVGRIPVLGVCLGHQALAHAHGGNVRAGSPVHGKQAMIERHVAPSSTPPTSPDLFDGLPTRFSAARYHSLHVEGSSLDPDWVVTARLAAPDDAAGMVMAMQHREHPVYGVQFHPESVSTPHGLAIIARFLEAA